MKNSSVATVPPSLASMSPTPDRLLKLPEIIGCKRRGTPGRIPMSRSKWYAGIEAGIFPGPVHLGRGSYWRESMINQIIEEASA